VHWRKRNTASAWKAPTPNTTSPQGTAELFFTSPRPVGRDQVIHEEDLTQPQGSEITHYQRGQRQIMWEIKITTHRQSDDLDALHYVNLITDRILLTAAKAAFEDAEMAFARIMATVDLSAIVASRDMSVFQMDILLNANSLTADTPIGYIETVEGDTEFTDASGSPVDPSGPFTMTVG